MPWLCTQALQRLQCETDPSSLGKSNWHGLRILGRSSLFIKLTVCTMLSGIVTEGVYELVSQFLQLKLGFSVLDMVRALAPKCTVDPAILQCFLGQCVLCPMAQVSQ